jgi:hypothetical protein
MIVSILDDTVLIYTDSLTHRVGHQGDDDGHDGGPYQVARSRCARNSNLPAVLFNIGVGLKSCLI